MRTERTSQAGAKDSRFQSPGSVSSAVGGEGVTASHRDRLRRSAYHLASFLALPGHVFVKLQRFTDLMRGGSPVVVRAQPTPFAADFSPYWHPLGYICFSLKDADCCVDSSTYASVDFSDHCYWESDSLMLPPFETRVSALLKPESIASAQWQEPHLTFPPAQDAGLSLS